MKKSPEKIKAQIEFWFFQYHRKDKELIDGNKQFTLFDLLDEESKETIRRQIKLRDNELPVLILRVTENQVVVNTTERFVRVTHSNIETIEYTDFERHAGFDSLEARHQFETRSIHIKLDDYLANFRIQKRNGEVIEWEIPTGSTGFGFWNITKKCELVGRKYLK